MDLVSLRTRSSTQVAGNSQASATTPAPPTQSVVYGHHIRTKQFNESLFIKNDFKPKKTKEFLRVFQFVSDVKCWAQHSLSLIRQLSPSRPLHQLRQPQHSRFSQVRPGQFSQIHQLNKFSLNKQQRAQRDFNFNCTDEHARDFHNRIANTNQLIREVTETNRGLQRTLEQFIQAAHQTGDRAVRFGSLDLNTLEIRQTQSDPRGLPEEPVFDPDDNDTNPSQSGDPDLEQPTGTDSRGPDTEQCHFKRHRTATNNQLSVYNLPQQQDFQAKSTQGDVTKAEQHYLPKQQRTNKHTDKVVTWLLSINKYSHYLLSELPVHIQVNKVYTTWDNFLLSVYKMYYEPNSRMNVVAKLNQAEQGFTKTDELDGIVQDLFLGMGFEQSPFITQYNCRPFNGVESKRQELHQIFIA
ncbi:hypothetical protein PROFUN_10686, partial [Planoprotostelium fungivorum]